MEKNILIEKVRNCTSGIEMLRMKEDILEHLGDKSVKKIEAKTKGKLLAISKKEGEIDG